MPVFRLQSRHFFHRSLQQAKLIHAEGCLRKLDEAAAIEAEPTSHAWTDFNGLQLAGYQGVCYRLLYQQHQQLPFLTKAQEALQGALAQLDPLQLRRQAVLHTDIAGIAVLQHDCEKACQHAMSAIVLTKQTKSGMAVQRLIELRQDLEQWKDTHVVSVFNEHLEALLR
jgi:ABC-type transporter Mla MlaB component